MKSTVFLPNPLGVPLLLLLPPYAHLVVVHPVAQEEVGQVGDLELPGNDPQIVIHIICHANISFLGRMQSLRLRGNMPFIFLAQLHPIQRT